MTTETETTTCTTCGKELDPSRESIWPNAAWFDVMRDNKPYCGKHVAMGREHTVGTQRVLAVRI